MFHLGRCYASQTFSNTPPGEGTQPRRVQISWQGGRLGQLSFPNELTLKNTSLGLRVCMLPVNEIKNLYSRSVILDGMKLKPGDDNPLNQLKGGLYHMDLIADLAKADQLILNVRGEDLVFTRHDRGITMMRDNKKLTVPDTKQLSLRILVDNKSTDVYLGEHGLYYSPGVNDPSPLKSMSIGVVGGEAEFSKLQVHELKSIWK
jgi:sucrose-6-phosphate hydrolase SacC (GH32 family)